MGNKFFLALLFMIPAVAVGRKYFTAAVFEHRPRGVDEEIGKQEILENLKYYEKATEVAAEKKADIIVFNEYGLYLYKKNKKIRKTLLEHVPDPLKTKFNPCTESKGDELILPALSCMARKNKIYVVANMGDIQPCEGTCDAKEIKSCTEKCPEEGVYMYNTNVVFDKEGNIVARYHKMHPYFEDLNVPEEPEYVTFNTNFGTFGLIICFDSVFEKAVLLARDHGIDTLIFPTFWFDDIVPLNAVEWQQSWAIANKVNFLAANTQTPGNGSLGSGIYSKYYGALVYSYEPDGESKLLVADVPLRKFSDIHTNPSITVIKSDSVQPKIETGDAFPENGYIELLGLEKDHYSEYRYFTYQMENYTLTKLVKESDLIEACNNEFCCKLNYQANHMNEDFYLGAFNGLNNVKGYFHWCEESCILVRCDPFESKACVMQASRSNTVFKNLKLSAKFSSERVYPTVSKNKHRLAPKTEWKYERKGPQSTLTFSSSSNEPLLKAALLGRCYQQDPEFIPYHRY